MSAAERVRPVEILLVEDSPSDALLAQEAFQYATVCNHVNLVTDGEEAMAFLRREGKYVRAPVPELILLDLDLPRKDGRQVLREIKEDASLRTIPVVVLATAGPGGDAAHSRGPRANCYIAKPMDFDRFSEVVGLIETFWFAAVAFPTEA
ncbi:MAG: response regulator [Isosphaeraceae bacterium]